MDHNGIKIKVTAVLMNAISCINSEQTRPQQQQSTIIGMSQCLSLSEELTQGPNMCGLLPHMILMPDLHLLQNIKSPRWSQRGALTRIRARETQDEKWRLER
ncbi:hypothetical protein Pcinc_012604 [Petrolisthes cinctipes]|uniref:Uncharacterized protein n=1 Tax=Petrolisthes cinctipes TaxID=88211 RepID=A0AAE1G0M2_PETCI|nr:hypothetical protein Pcinc_012604 [Petrolisthes cinctipes]